MTVTFPALWTNIQIPVNWTPTLSNCEDPIWLVRFLWYWGSLLVQIIDYKRVFIIGQWYNKIHWFGTRVEKSYRQIVVYIRWILRLTSLTNQSVMRAFPSRKPRDDLPLLFCKDYSFLFAALRATIWWRLSLDLCCIEKVHHSNWQLSSRQRPGSLCWWFGWIIYSLGWYCATANLAFATDRLSFWGRRKYCWRIFYRRGPKTYHCRGYKGHSSHQQD